MKLYIEIWVGRAFAGFQPAAHGGEQRFQLFQVCRFRTHGCQRGGFGFYNKPRFAHIVHLLFSVQPSLREDSVCQIL